MKVLRDLIFGLLSAAASGVIVLGAVSLALVEGMATQPDLIPEPVRPTLMVQIDAQQQTVEYPSSSENTLPAVLPTPTPSALPSTCLPPTDWVNYMIEPGDTVEALARRHNITPDTLRDANCLNSDMLLPAYLLYLPALSPTNTPASVPPTITPVPCGPPWGWVRYTVRPGDTLFKLSLAYRVSVPQIQFANCMGSSTYIRYGQILYLPYVIPIRTAVPTAVPSFTSTATLLTPTRIIVQPTLTFTQFPTATLPFTPTLTFTATHTPLPTLTFTATNTPMPTPTFTATFTDTPVPIPTDTPVLEAPPEGEVSP